MKVSPGPSLSKCMLTECAYTFQAVSRRKLTPMQALRMWDSNGDGRVDIREFRTIVESLNIPAGGSLPPNGVSVKLTPRILKKAVCVAIRTSLLLAWLQPNEGFQ